MFLSLPFRRAPAQKTDLSECFVIVGLGNPGRYAHTRHNVGYGIIDLLSEQWDIPVKTRKHHSRIGTGEIAGRPVLLMKPETFMNLSGRALQSLRASANFPLERLVVLCDDLNLPLGRIRIRRNGSHGGQKGLRSIIEGLGSQEFSRLRIGIGGTDLPPEQWVDFVLSRFEEEERPVVNEALSRAAEATAHLVSEGIDSAMSKYN